MTPDSQLEVTTLYLRMPLKPIELSPAVSRRFFEDMSAFHAKPNAIKREEVAARQLHALKQYYAGKLRPL